MKYCKSPHNANQYNRQIKPFHETIRLSNRSFKIKAKNKRRQKDKRPEPIKRKIQNKRRCKSKTDQRTTS